MATTTGQSTGSAKLQGELWGARAADWAEVQEDQCRPLFQSVLQETVVRSGMSLLDIGCGAGRLCELSAKRGAKVTGVDASAARIGIARTRTKSGDFRVGAIEDLPFADHCFDVVMAINSVQYADDPVRALREARRVARPGAPVVIATWGQQHDCQAAVYLSALGALLPPAPRGAPGPFALASSGALEEFAQQAGLEPEETFDVDCPWEYRDLATALRGLLSAGPAVQAIRAVGEHLVRESVARSIAPFRTTLGMYRLSNRFHYLISRA